MAGLKPATTWCPHGAIRHYKHKTMINRIVIITKKTALEELTYRLNTREQAQFYLEQNQISFAEYARSDTVYQQAVQSIRQQLPRAIKQQFIDREFLPNYQFDANDLVITVGPDGLVVNTAKYLTTQPILALNPDPSRIDGVLVPFQVHEAAAQIERVLRSTAPIKQVSMARALLNDGQEIIGFNDLFIGPRTHGSARYELQLGDQREQQSSSGIIVSTGAGCTGWLRSITTGAWQVARHFSDLPPEPPNAQQLALGWEADRLWFSVREPFPSKSSQTTLVFGQIERGQELVITSQMPDAGVIFSDGVQEDFLAFNSGVIARVSLAERKAHVVVR